MISLKIRQSFLLLKRIAAVAASYSKRREGPKRAFCKVLKNKTNVYKRKYNNAFAQNVKKISQNRKKCLFFIKYGETIHKS